MKPYRKQRLASVIRSIIGEALIHRLSDPRIETLTTVSRVELSGDLQIARVFFSVPGGTANERKTMSAIQGARGVLQRMVAAGLSMRHCPELHFAIDEIGKKAMTTLQLIEENRKMREAAEELAPDEELGHIGYPSPDDAPLTEPDSGEQA